MADAEVEANQSSTRLIEAPKQAESANDRLPSDAAIDVDRAEKSDDTTAPDRPSRQASASPDSKCSICLGELTNKSFTDVCFHTFCFVCLLEWSRVRAICPLCKQPFTSIVHNVLSFSDYEQTPVQPAANRAAAAAEEQRRFRYRSTLTLDRRAELRRDSLLRQFESLQRPSRRPPSLFTRPSSGTSAFRRHVYATGARAILTPSVRRADTSAVFFAHNPACVHRLGPWLNRELNVLLGGGEGRGGGTGVSGGVVDVYEVLQMVLMLVAQVDMTGEEFYTHVYPLVGRRTRHFMHEFHAFASSALDMAQYDQRCVYREEEDAQRADVTDVETVLSPQGASGGRAALAGRVRATASRRWNIGHRQLMGRAGFAATPLPLRHDVVGLSSARSLASRYKNTPRADCVGIGVAEAWRQPADGMTSSSAAERVVAPRDFMMQLNRSRSPVRPRELVITPSAREWVATPSDRSDDSDDDVTIVSPVIQRSVSSSSAAMRSSLTPAVSFVPAKPQRVSFQLQRRVKPAAASRWDTSESDLSDSGDDGNRTQDFRSVGTSASAERPFWLAVQDSSIAGGSGLKRPRSSVLNSPGAGKSVLSRRFAAGLSGPLVARPPRVKRVVPAAVPASTSQVNKTRLRPFLKPTDGPSWMQSVSAGPQASFPPGVPTPAPVVPSTSRRLSMSSDSSDDVEIVAYDKPWREKTPISLEDTDDDSGDNNAYDNISDDDDDSDDDDNEVEAAVHGTGALENEAQLTSQATELADVSQPACSETTDAVESWTPTQPESGTSSLSVAKISDVVRTSEFSACGYKHSHRRHKSKKENPEGSSAVARVRHRFKKTKHNNSSKCLHGHEHRGKKRVDCTESSQSRSVSVKRSAVTERSSSRSINEFTSKDTLRDRSREETYEASMMSDDESSESRERGANGQSGIKDKNLSNSSKSKGRPEAKGHHSKKRHHDETESSGHRPSFRSAGSSRHSTKFQYADDAKRRKTQELIESDGSLSFSTDDGVDDVSKNYSRLRSVIVCPNNGSVNQPDIISSLPSERSSSLLEQADHVSGCTNRGGELEPLSQLEPSSNRCSDDEEPKTRDVNGAKQVYVRVSEAESRHRHGHRKRRKHRRHHKKRKHEKCVKESRGEDKSRHKISKHDGINKQQLGGEMCSDNRDESSWGDPVASQNPHGDPVQESSTNGRVFRPRNRDETFGEASRSAETIADLLPFKSGGVHSRNVASSVDNVQADSESGSVKVIHSAGGCDQRSTHWEYLDDVDEDDDCCVVVEVAKCKKNMTGHKKRVNGK